MPRLPADYSKCVMYKIECKDLSVKGVYIGHTTNFVNRKGQHKCNCNRETGKVYNIKLYETIRANGGWDNYTMIIVEEYPCKNSTEARMRENELYHDYNAELNKVRPYITEEERGEYSRNHYERNREHYMELNRQYKDRNKVQQYALNRQYAEKNKERIKEYQKLYGEQNKEKLRLYYREYYLKKKEEEILKLSK